MHGNTSNQFVPNVFSGPVWMALFESHFGGSIVVAWQVGQCLYVHDFGGGGGPPSQFHTGGRGHHLHSPQVHVLQTLIREGGRRTDSVSALLLVWHCE